ncbi:TetR/AcrR family transcriptional regulator [Streptomyces sp. NPDC046977]|uniref:TetR/AcrR family transcriptional regulator n=1 Tax=Streptomyces sp. NPDC046977 TaxID=3154703 RepID=UPI0033CD8F0B
MDNKRTYEMKARAETTAQTRRRIMRSAFELANETKSLEIVVADVAARAGVSVRTVLRHFGSRDGLFEAVTAYVKDEVREERAAPVGDVATAVEVLFDHYEARGEMVLRLLGEEAADPRVRSVTDQGRLLHRAWVEQVFAPQLAGRGDADRELVTDLLAVATDVYTWKLLFRDRGLDRQQAQQRVRFMIDAVLGTVGEER